MGAWELKHTDADIAKMCEVLGINPVTALVLANRGIRTKNTAIKYLNPDKKFMYKAALLKDIGEAAVLVRKAIERGEKIAVYGDYDVDGVTSTVILYKTFARFGADVMYYIPDRESEGYGLNVNAVHKLSDMGVKLLVTCDNGIAASPEIAEAAGLGLETVIIDHHEPPFVLQDGVKTCIIPKAGAVIDPKQSSCEYPDKNLCAGALAFKFSEFLHGFFEAPFELENECLIFAAIATLCDIVPLLDENRIIAKNGLRLLNSPGGVSNLGLKALIEERKLRDKPIDEFSVGFILGPCVNAAGRLEHASAAVELFLSGETCEAQALAQKLARLNDERKQLTSVAVDSVLKGLEGSTDKVIVIYDGSQGLHESVAGIVAGRIKDMTGHPVVLLCPGADGLAKGSARSVEGYNIYDELSKHKHLFERFGGHEMAAGLTLKKENIDALREGLNSECALTDISFEKRIRLDGEISLNSVTFELERELAYLRPFGKDNREPVFCSRGVTADTIEAIGAEKKTLRFTFSLDNGCRLKGICFNQHEKAALIAKNGPLKNAVTDIAYTIGLNEYNGKVSLQIVIIDFDYS